MKNFALNFSGFNHVIILRVEERTWIHSVLWCFAPLAMKSTQKVLKNNFYLQAAWVPFTVLFIVDWIGVFESLGGCRSHLIRLIQLHEGQEVWSFILTGVVVENKRTRDCLRAATDGCQRTTLACAIIKLWHLFAINIQSLGPLLLFFQFWLDSASNKQIGFCHESSFFKKRSALWRLRRLSSSSSLLSLLSSILSSSSVSSSASTSQHEVTPLHFRPKICQLDPFFLFPASFCFLFPFTLSTTHARTHSLTTHAHLHSIHMHTQACTQSR